MGCVLSRQELHFHQSRRLSRWHCSWKSAFDAGPRPHRDEGGQSFRVGLQPSNPRSRRETLRHIPSRSLSPIPGTSSNSSKSRGRRLASDQRSYPERRHRGDVHALGPRERRSDRKPFDTLEIEYPRGPIVPPVRLRPGAAFGLPELGRSLRKSTCRSRRKTLRASGSSFNAPQAPWSTGGSAPAGEQLPEDRCQVRAGRSLPAADQRMSVWPKLLSFSFTLPVKPIDQIARFPKRSPVR